MQKNSHAFQQRSFPETLKHKLLLCDYENYAKNPTVKYMSVIAIGLQQLIEHFLALKYI